MREIVFRITFRFFRESDKVGLVKEYPLDADANEDDVDGPLNDDGHRELSFCFSLPYPL